MNIGLIKLFSDTAIRIGNDLIIFDFLKATTFKNTRFLNRALKMFAGIAAGEYISDKIVTFTGEKIDEFADKLVNGIKKEEGNGTTA